MADAHPPLLSLSGLWHLWLAGQTLSFRVSLAPAADNSLPGLATLLSASDATVELVSWHSDRSLWVFRLHEQDGWRWFRGTVRAGVFAGRCTLPVHTTEPPPVSAYCLHVTGWNSTQVDSSPLTRVYDLVLNGQSRACLRLDCDSLGSALGRLKVYATLVNDAWDACGEELEFDLDVLHWDGNRVLFRLRQGTHTLLYTGEVAGAGLTIAGTWRYEPDGPLFPWQGARSEVLSYGLCSKTARQRQLWQTMTRSRLALLLMAGNPQPLQATWETLAHGCLPCSGLPTPPEMRDDDPASWPQDYMVDVLQFTWTLADPYGSGTITRQARARLALPTRPPGQDAGYRVALVLHGHGSPTHGGSSAALLDAADGAYWYGDAFARRGFVVLALDISHRPLADRASLYQDALAGDDPARGNGTHPAITSPIFPHDSDWEEDGERVWDALQALYLLLNGSLGVPVDPRYVLVAGLSLGAEIATLCAALEPRISLAISAGFAPDLHTLLYRHNHPCWRWIHADLPMYFSLSDWHALIAPRPLIVQTGLADSTFSACLPPSAADKQVLRRSRAAYGEEARFLVHYLHCGLDHEPAHRLRVGDRSCHQTAAAPTGLTVPLACEPSPSAPWSVAWQTDTQVLTLALPTSPIPHLFAHIDHFWHT